LRLARLRWVSGERGRVVVVVGVLVLDVACGLVAGRIGGGIVVWWAAMLEFSCDLCYCVV